MLSDSFLANNTLSDDRRYSVTEVGTNMARALATNAVEGDVWAELSSQDYKALPPVGTVTLSYQLKGSLLVPKPRGEKPDAKNDIRIRFTPPGGGRGYYRTPSLVSMWATAPYFHNNALGDYYVIHKDGSKGWAPNDGRLIEDPIDPSVEGRMKMFQDGVEKLLWPQKRRSYIKRTQEDCQLLELQPAIRHLLPGILAQSLGDLLEEKLDAAVDQLIKEKHLPPPAADRLRQGLRDLARKELAELRRRLPIPGARPEDLKALQKELAALVQDRLAAQALALASPEHAAALKGKLEAVPTQLARDLQELADFASLKIPKGTPINLYFNLHISALPYAVKAHIKYRHDPRQLVETLLRLSDCPDLVEDKGHEYGSELTDSEKHDLIEFLKTL